MTHDASEMCCEAALRRRACRRALILNAVQLTVNALPRQQFFMRTLLRDYTAIEDDDLVRISDSAEPVRDGDHGTALHQLGETFHDEAFRFRVQGSRWLGQYQGWGVSDNRPRNPYTLGLTARYSQTPLAYLRVVTIRHRRDEVVRVGKLRRLDDLGIRCAGAAVSDVGFDGPPEQHRILQDKTDLLAQRLFRVLHRIHAIDQDPTIVGVVEAWNESDHGRLAASCGADHAQPLTCFDDEINALEDRRPDLIAEVHVLEGDCALDGFQRPRVGTILDDVIGVQNAFDAFQCDGRLGNRVGIFRQILHGFEEFTEVRQKHGQRAHGHQVSENERRPAP